MYDCESDTTKKPILKSTRGSYEPQAEMSQLLCVVSLETLTAQVGEKHSRAQYDRESQNEKLQELPIVHLKVTAPRSNWEINEADGCS